MGRNKALLPFRGKALVELQRDRLAPLFERVVVAAADPEPYRPFGIEVVPDLLPERSALTGVHAILSAARTPHAFVVAVDLLFLNPRLVEWLLARRKRWDVLVPESDGKVEPLHALYSRRCLAPIEDAARRGAWKVDGFYPSVRTRVEPVRTQDWLVEGRSPFFNANTPAEWDSARP